MSFSHFITLKELLKEEQGNLFPSRTQGICCQKF